MTTARTKGIVLVRPPLQARGSLDAERRAAIRVRRHRLASDESTVEGGGDTAPSPAELLLSALVGSLISVAADAASSLGLELRSMDVDVKAMLDPPQRERPVLARGYVHDIEVDITFLLEGALRDLRPWQTRVEGAPIANLLRQSGAQLAYRWQRI